MKIRISFEIDLSARRVADIEQYGSLKKAIKRFINDSITSWGGCYHPEDPFFESLPAGKLFRVEQVTIIPKKE